MKWIKRGLAALLSVFVLTVGYGCSSREYPAQASPTVPPTPTAEPLIPAHETNPAGFIKFSRSTEPRELYVPVEEIMEYESMYSDCNSTWFRNQLTGEDLLIYNSYLYALEHRYIFFHIYVEDSDRDFSYIREALSLDSPFLEQNYSHYEDIWKNPINYVGKSITVSMEQFTDSRWEMKMEALEICRQIVAGIPPEYETQLEKMEYLYQYVCDYVEYVEYDSMVDESYFYDAVCRGETVCDGYSNMLSLLFHLIGVECCEAMGSSIENFEDATAEELANSSGHTWVVAKLDGQFYNFDPTFEDTDDTKTDGVFRFFGFSDDLLPVEYPCLEELRPKCTDTSRDFSYADLIVSSVSDRSEVQRIADLTLQRAENGEYTTVIAVSNTVSEEQYDEFIGRYSQMAPGFTGVSTSTFHMRSAALLHMTLLPG